MIPDKSLSCLILAMPTLDETFLSPVFSMDMHLLQCHQSLGLKCYHVYSNMTLLTWTFEGGLQPTPWRGRAIESQKCLLQLNKDEDSIPIKNGQNMHAW